MIMTVAGVLGVSCSSHTVTDDGEDSPFPDRREVCVLISAPAAAKQNKLPGDPGEDVPEGDVWDRLAVIFAYHSDVVYKVFDREAYNNAAQDKDGYRLLTMTVPVGQARIFGVTYNDGAAESPAAAIAACHSLSAVCGLTISNGYARGSDGLTDGNRFVSVATGSTSGMITIEDEDEDNKADLQPIANITLTRLAVKVDIQYDAQDAYNNRYTDVQIPGFTYKGTDSGYLFPGENTAPLPSSASGVTFINSTPISRRNGRVYHYTFTDGRSQPVVMFDISATAPDGTLVKKDYTLQYPVLNPAGWYKGTLTVKGLNTTGSTVEVTPEEENTQNG